MALYQDRNDWQGDISLLKQYIATIELQIRGLGLCWFGEKSKKKRQLKAELSNSKKRLRALEEGYAFESAFREYFDRT